MARMAFPGSVVFVTLEGAAIRQFDGDGEEVLADLAVEHGVAKVEAKAELRCLYRARLEGRRAPAIADSRGPLAPQI